MSDLLQQTADAIFEKWCTSDRIDACVEVGWDAELWAVLEQSGLTSIGVEEGTLAEVATVVRSAGAHSAMVPLAEHLVLAWLLHSAGIAQPAGPLGLRGLDVRNLAGEPRGASEDLAATAPAPLREEASLRSTLLRAVLLTGAGERALELTVRYVKEREAFGRPIAQFQAVQQQVAQMAAEVALMRASSDGAVLMAEQQGVLESELAIRSAFAACAAAAGTVARIAHQMHGAIGYTYEHVLRHSTLRLWSWRDEDGGEAGAARRVGELARSSGGHALWTLLTGL